MLSEYKPSDKIWIYTSNEEFSDEQISIIDGYATNFLHAWESHGASVKGTVKILHKRFILVAADDCDGSMCGRAQDAQVKLIKALEEELDITLLDRMLIAFKNDEGKVDVTSMNNFQELLKSKTFSEDTIVFNNMITLVGEFDMWEVPVKESWHNNLISSL
jgi:hypothetical protein